MLDFCSFPDFLTRQNGLFGKNVVRSAERRTVIETIPAILKQSAFDDMVRILSTRAADHAFVIVAGEYTISECIAVQKHFLGTALLSGCRLKAADVNADNNVNTLDVLAIRQFFLGHSSANVGKYQFTPANRSYPGIVSDQTAQNFDTLIFGDVISAFADRVGGSSQDADQ